MWIVGYNCGSNYNTTSKKKSIKVKTMVPLRRGEYGREDSNVWELSLQGTVTCSHNSSKIWAQMEFYTKL